MPLLSNATSGKEYIDDVHVIEWAGCIDGKPGLTVFCGSIHALQETL